MFVDMRSKRPSFLENQRVEVREYNTQWWQQMGVEEPTLVLVLQSIVAFSLIFGLAALFMFV